MMQQGGTTLGKAVVRCGIGKKIWLDKGMYKPGTGSARSGLQ